MSQYSKVKAPRSASPLKSRWAKVTQGCFISRLPDLKHDGTNCSNISLNRFGAAQVCDTYFISFQCHNVTTLTKGAVAVQKALKILALPRLARPPGQCQDFESFLYGHSSLIGLLWHQGKKVYSRLWGEGLYDSMPQLNATIVTWWSATTSLDVLTASTNFYFFCGPYLSKFSKLELSKNAPFEAISWPKILGFCKINILCFGSISTSFTFNRFHNLQKQIDSGFLNVRTFVTA